MTHLRPSRDQSDDGIADADGYGVSVVSVRGFSSQLHRGPSATQVSADQVRLVEARSSDDRVDRFHGSADEQGPLRLAFPERSREPTRLTTAAGPCL